MLNLAQLTTLKINCSQDPRKKKGWEEKKKKRYKPPYSLFTGSMYESGKMKTTPGNPVQKKIRTVKHLYPTKATKYMNILKKCLRKSTMERGLQGSLLHGDKTNRDEQKEFCFHR